MTSLHIDIGLPKLDCLDCNQVFVFFKLMFLTIFNFYQRLDGTKITTGSLLLLGIQQHASDYFQFKQNSLERQVVKAIMSLGVSNGRNILMLLW